MQGMQTEKTSFEVLSGSCKNRIQQVEKVKENRGKKENTGRWE